MLDNLDLIKSKTDMLNNLLDIEITYSLLSYKSSSSGEDQDPIDQHYNKLKCEIEVLAKDSVELKILYYMLKILMLLHIHLMS